VFENLLHQEEVVSQLKQEIIGGSLAPSSLFSGPSLSGKLTAALELARISCCEDNRRWNCQCRHCRAHRLLLHPRTILMGHRSLIPEITACADLMRRESSDTSRYLMVRSVRKLLCRFDSVLWDGEKKKLFQLRSVMERLTETVDSILPGKGVPEGVKQEMLLSSLVADCLAMQKALPDILPVDQIRHVCRWAHHSAGKDHKIIIIDSAERMSDASKNALLKFLEEPPADTSIILITEHKQMLSPTIISRLRAYPFKNRSRMQEAEIIRRIFREKGEGLQAFFGAWRRKSSSMVIAKQFIEQANSNNRTIPGEALEIRDLEELRDFLKALGIELRDRWRKTASPKHKSFRSEQDGIRDARIRAENLNLPIPLVLRGLYRVMSSF